ncbi:hypothetical protein H4R23_002410, partial [Coemansia sp. Cherry 401B]
TARRWTRARATTSKCRQCLAPAAGRLCVEIPNACQRLPRMTLPMWPASIWPSGGRPGGGSCSRN